jgi:nucleotide-binding universal stress UspA family protein
VAKGGVLTAKVQTLVRLGDFLSEILDAAHDSQADMILLAY